ncbi:hypothetical protein ACFE04_030896 [Oxalis oulophora]
MALGRRFYKKLISFEDEIDYVPKGYVPILVGGEEEGEDEKQRFLIQTCKAAQELGYDYQGVIRIPLDTHINNLQIALEILDKTTHYGIEPRLSTHAMFIKVYFNVVVASSEKYKSSSNMIYSLLAKLYLKNRNLAKAYTILHKMSEKGLRPYFSE